MIAKNNNARKYRNINKIQTYSEMFWGRTHVWFGNHDFKYLVKLQKNNRLV